MPRILKTRVFSFSLSMFLKLSMTVEKVEAVFKVLGSHDIAGMFACATQPLRRHWTMCRKLPASFEEPKYWRRRSDRRFDIEPAQTDKHRHLGSNFWLGLDFLEDFRVSKMNSALEYWCHFFLVFFQWTFSHARSRRKYILFVKCQSHSKNQVESHSVKLILKKRLQISYIHGMFPLTYFLRGVLAQQYDSEANQPHA